MSTKFKLLGSQAEHARCLLGVAVNFVKCKPPTEALMELQNRAATISKVIGSASSWSHTMKHHHGARLETGLEDTSPLAHTFPQIQQFLS